MNFIPPGWGRIFNSPLPKHRPDVFKELRPNTLIHKQGTDTRTTFSLAVLFVPPKDSLDDFLYPVVGEKLGDLLTVHRVASVFAAASDNPSGRLGLPGFGGTSADAVPAIQAFSRMIDGLARFLVSLNSVFHAGLCADATSDARFLVPLRLDRPLEAEVHPVSSGAINGTP